MNLPDGVWYTPGQFERWIAITAKPGEAWITIDPALGYTVNDRDFGESFQKLFSEDFHAFARRYHLIERSPVYSGAEHTGDPKLPNITVLPNIPTRWPGSMHLKFDKERFGIGRDFPFSLFTGQEVTLFDCTMGHWHGQTDCPDRIQELYEFQGYGALVVDRPENGEVELWVARDGDKVAVPQQCHMTLYNLDDLDHPLITLDFANPDRNYANKELVARVGPLLLAYYTPYEAVFVLNRHYINHERIHVRPDEFIDGNSPPPGEVDNRNCLHGGVRLPEPLPGREVRIPLGARASLGQQLYEALTSDAETIIRFARLGIRVRKASPEVQLDGAWYSRSLAEAVKWGKANRLYRFFFSGSGKATQGESEDKEVVPGPKRPLHEGEKDWLRKGARLLEPGREEGEPAQRDIQIFIEGAGDWTNLAIIPSIEQAREELAVRRQRERDLPDFTVLVTDDSRWHSPGEEPPVKPNPQIYPDLRRVIDEGLNQGKSYDIAPKGVRVEPRKVTFLDKADNAHLDRYQQLRPGIVFIVTPDYTHSALCRAHLDRASTIFVEKPFDANWENVRALLEARGRAALDTEIYALDHYRFYSWLLRDWLEEATHWLGGALREARFCMTEEKPVESYRIRSLQYGLMLDMLPHCFGMLAFFGKLESVDEFEVLEVGRYEGAPIPNETYVHVRFTFEDYSENGWRVPCEAWVGKGLKPSRKYFEVVGRSDRSVIIALSDNTTWRWQGRNRSLEKGGIYFVDENGDFIDEQGRKTEDPRAPLDKDRYKQLFLDLITGERKAIVCVMPLADGERIVHALDRFWNAIQACSPWRPYELERFDCF